MIFIEKRLKGTFLIEPERLEDDRGFFARTWCQQEFERHGLNSHMVQCNISFNKKSFTLRGMHYQIAPFQEAKLVRCTKGAIFDVIIDLRSESPTYKHWLGVKLTEENYKMLYVPENFAHGYQTLRDNTEVYYHVSQSYSPEFERGVRWDDPSFNIMWPETDKSIISEKDQRWPDYR